MTDSLPKPARKRAILWLCWGEAFVRDAIESARSAVTLDADRVLITDTRGEQQAHDAALFTTVVAVDFTYRSNLEKSRLIDLLPAAYDTFLYLDTDVRIIGDVSLGFDKAERHGIAVVPAPNYNLEEYFGFGEIMARGGAVAADRMMYNAGVIFFHLTPPVRRVLERWRDLCAEFGVKFDCQHDQPFLTLAFEQFDFAPYVLSPSYNYRGLGEYAVGEVRIWHSHFPPPAGLNLFDTAWPGRRFRDGKRVLTELDPATSEPATLPQGMARLMLPEFRRRRLPGAIDAVIAQALVVQGEQGSRSANRFLLRQIGVDPLADRDEAYYSEALDYLLGLLHAHAGEPEKMAARLGHSHTMPAGEDDHLYSDHVNQSLVLRGARMRAIERGLPPILIACMPRSASATLTHSLGRALRVPVLHLSAGRFPSYFLVPSWLDMFLEGGAITQDHFAASAFNLGVLNARGPRDLFVLIRDPRAAARSQVHYLADESEPGEPLETAIERECIAHFLPWLQGWIDCANNPETPLQVHWISYQEVCRDRAAVLRRISAVLQGAHPAMSAFVDCRAIPEVNIHFETGNDDAWKAEIGRAARDRIWQACSLQIRSLLGLEW